MRQKVMSIAVAASLVMNSMPVKAMDDMFEKDAAPRVHSIVTPAALEEIDMINLIKVGKSVISNPNAAVDELGDQVSTVARNGTKIFLDRLVDLTGVAASGIVTYFTASPEMGLIAGNAVRGLINSSHITDKIADLVGEKVPSVVKAVANGIYNAGQKFTNCLFGRNQTALVVAAPAA